MKRDFKCVLCKGDMQILDIDRLKHSNLVPVGIPKAFSDKPPIEAYVCKECGKIELFRKQAENTSGISQKKCPSCGASHDIDYPKCPFCRYDYNAK